MKPHFLLKYHVFSSHLTLEHDYQTIISPSKNKIILFMARIAFLLKFIFAVEFRCVLAVK